MEFLNSIFYSNIIDYIKNLLIALKGDFLGVSFNPTGTFIFILGNILAIFIFLNFYYLGEKIRVFLNFTQKPYNPFINFSLGYFLTGTIIAFLGLFNFLYYLNLLILFLISLTYSLYKFIESGDVKNIFKPLKLINRNDVFTLLTIIFIILSFIRLINLNIHEDGYHTDLANLYLKTHTINHEAKDFLFVIPYAQLPEMIYTIPVAFLGNEPARSIHFGFYLLIILLFLKYGESDKNAKYSAFLFATVPIVTRYSSSQYTDFFYIYSFLLSMFLLVGQKNKSLFLSGLMYGGSLSAKLWSIVFYPIFIIFILIKGIKTYKKMPFIIYFTMGMLTLSCFWLIRSFILTGSPIAPFFTNYQYIGRPFVEKPISVDFITFALKINTLFILDNFKSIGPLIPMGLAFLIMGINKKFKTLTKNPFFIFYVLLTFLYLVINFYGRYLFPWIALSAIFASYGMVMAINKFKIIKYIIVLISLLIFSYYSISAFLLLPYGLGWADQNKYLTRTLIRDDASYYDFDYRFSKFISDKDLVATYSVVSFYYADFNYKDVNYIFDLENPSLNQLKQKGSTKLLIKGGDINWFCVLLKIRHCNNNQVNFLSSYVSGDNKFFLYELK